jgi:hypothetical protein
VVQETRGHASPFVTGNLRKFPFGAVCPFFSTPKSTHQPDEPFLRTGGERRMFAFLASDSCTGVIHSHFPAALAEHGGKYGCG